MIETPQNTSKRDNISKKELERLLGTSEPYCISIFIPTHPHGEDVLQGRDAQAFEVQLREIRKELESHSLSDKDIESRLHPLETLRGDSDFWREQTEGLAVFASSDLLKIIKLPMSVKPLHRLSSAFYLLPLVAVLKESQEFYVLSLELERIRLFKGKGESIMEIPLKDRIPERMEDRVGYDYEEKGLQFRSQHQAHEAAGYHGHAEADRDRKNEIKRFFRDVDKGIRPILQEEPAPLVLASQQYLAGIYRTVCTYPHLVDETLVANLSEAKPEELMRKTLELLKPWTEKDRREKWDRFREFHGTGKATSQLSQILQAALEGRVDTLFIKKDAEAWGNFNTATGKMEMEEDPDAFTGSLLNKALTLTLQQGGEVYLKEPEEMPEGAQYAVALFRY